jgi:uncharacterized membrane protein YesL
MAFLFFIRAFCTWNFSGHGSFISVMRKLIMSTENVSILKLFWKTFKVEFIKANIIGYIFLIVGVLLYIDLRVLQQLDTNFFNLLITIITYIIGLLYLLTLLHVFPIFVHFNLKTRDYIKYAFILSIGRPLQSLLMIIILGIMIVLLIQVPGLIPVFGVSLTSLIIMKVSSGSFPEINAASPSLNRD